MWHFRAIPLLATLALGCRLPAQSGAVTDLQQALVGSWVGTLEYRDYSEPATSTKRVKLPTWLGIELAGTDLRFRYVYDDGPAKTVTETSLIHIDPAAARYEVIGLKGKIDDGYTIEGLAQLRQGRGTLTLTGKGTENDAPVEVRMRIRIGRNILEMTRETGAAGTQLTFRHAYTFVRSAPPAA